MILFFGSAASTLAGLAEVAVHAGRRGLSVAQQVLTHSDLLPLIMSVRSPLLRNHWHEPEVHVLT